MRHGEIVIRRGELLYLLKEISRATSVRRSYHVRATIVSHQCDYRVTDVTQQISQRKLHNSLKKKTLPLLSTG